MVKPSAKSSQRLRALLFTLLARHDDDAHKQICVTHFIIEGNRNTKQLCVCVCVC